MAARRKRKPQSVHSDFGPDERRRHGPGVVERVPDDLADTTNRDRMRMIETDDPLYVFRRNRVISVRQRDAGLVLREIWNRTGKEPRVIGQYSDMIGSGSVTESMLVRTSDVEQRFINAVRLVGPIGGDTVMTVVCLQEFIPRGHYEILRRALDILGDNFGV